MSESERAVMESILYDAETTYFEARPQIDTAEKDNIMEPVTNHEQADPTLKVELPHPARFFDRGDFTFDGLYTAHQMINYAKSVVAVDRENRK